MVYLTRHLNLEHNSAQNDWAAVYAQLHRLGHNQGHNDLQWAKQIATPILLSMDKKDNESKPHMSGMKCKCKTN